MGIIVKNITHIYSEGLPHESVALDDVSFTIEDGQFVGIIGHTGSGKSTLLQHLNGLLKPKSGSIVIGDVDITSPDCRLRDIRKKIGLVFQYPEYQLFEETVEKDVAFGPRNLRDFRRKILRFASARRLRLSVFPMKKSRRSLRLSFRAARSAA